MELASTPVSTQPLVFFKNRPFCWFRMIRIHDESDKFMVTDPSDLSGHACIHPLSVGMCMSTSWTFKNQSLWICLLIELSRSYMNQNVKRYVNIWPVSNNGLLKLYPVPFQPLIQPKSLATEQFNSLSSMLIEPSYSPFCATTILWQG